MPDSPELKDESSLFNHERLAVRTGRLGSATCFVFEGTCHVMPASLRDSLRDLLVRILDTPGDLVFDVSGLKYANSTFLGLLVRAADREGDSRVALVGAGKQIVDMLEVLGVLGLFQRHDSLSEVESASRRTPERGEAGAEES